MSLIRKHGAVLQAWACLDLVYLEQQTYVSSALYWRHTNSRFTYILADLLT